MTDPGRTAIGTWSGGRFMHFGEALDDERLDALLRPATASTRCSPPTSTARARPTRSLGRALAGLDRDSYSPRRRGRPRLLRGRARRARRASPASPTRACAGPTATRTTCGWRPSAASSGSAPTRFDLLLLHNPDRTGYESEAVWDGDGRAARRRDSTELIGVAPGPANGFTLDLIGCLERFGDRIDWAMIILNPLEPWPGELVPRRPPSDTACSVITRVVDYGGLFWGDLAPGRTRSREGDHRGFRPAGWIEAGRERIERLRPIAERHGLTPLQLACHWNLAHPAVECVVPTLIQEAGPEARPIEEKRAELAALPQGQPLSTPRSVAADPRDRRQHGLHGAQGRQPRPRGTRAARPLGAHGRADGDGRALRNRPTARLGRGRLSGVQGGILRGLVVALTAGGLVLGTATALGFSVGDWNGRPTGDPSGQVAFDVTKHDGVKKVRQFTVFKVTYTCEADPSGRTEGMQLIEPMRVHGDGTFSGEGEFTILMGDPSGTVEGKFANGKAKGSFKVKGELAGPGSDCKTGRQDWTATKTNH